MAEVRVRFPLDAFQIRRPEVGGRNTKCEYSELRSPNSDLRIYLCSWPIGRGARLPIWSGEFDSRRALFLNSECGITIKKSPIPHSAFGIPAHRSSLEWTPLCQGGDHRFESGMGRFCNAEWGMRNAECRMGNAKLNNLIPHSAHPIDSMCGTPTA